MASATISCQSTDCINSNPPSHLECPTCNKLGIKGSFFCTQECFKKGWVNFSELRSHSIADRGVKKTHKIVHGIVNPPASTDGSFNPFPNFPFTGSLRPIYPLSPKRIVPDHIVRPDYADDADGFPKSESIAQGRPPRILTLEEQEKMRVACKLGREVLDIAASHVRPGISTDELDEIVHNATIERNAYPSPLNYKRFPKSVCTSVNEVICHGIPDRRKLREGDIVNLDVSLYYDGFHADLNETYPVGEIDDDSKRLIRTTRESLDAAIALCKPGTLFRDLGKAIEPVAKKNGCSVVRTYTGHGINNLFHPSPNIPHYAKNKAIGTMKPGMAFTIEPMLNLGPSWDTIHWPDNWTATTVDGRRSAQFEDTLLVTETGIEVLTAGSKKDV